jgi:fumarate hydratase class II
VKACAASANGALGALEAEVAEAVERAAMSVARGEHDAQFPVDVFQTGSGTSTNMNANEVIAALASRELGRPIHPNDHVNRSQSSNDVIPTTIHVSAARALRGLKGSIGSLARAIDERSRELAEVVKTGRTHLMDALPLTLGQELSGWAAQLDRDVERIESTEPRVLEIAQGGTAIGTGLNAPPGFAPRFAAELARRTGLAFVEARSPFERISCQDTAAELSGQLRVTACTLAKIANDLRWMNSGPLAGLGEIRLPELQAGSSIMPAKVNPVIPEAVAMACAQVVGLDAAVAAAAQDSRFQLNTMLPLIGCNLLEQIGLLERAARALEEKAILRFEVDRERLRRQAERNPMLVTALTPRVGYDLGARIARRAALEDRPVIEIARELTDIPEAELRTLLDPLGLTRSRGESD